MKTLSALVHFETRHERDGAPDGGFAHVYGRFADWGTFEEEVVRHFRRHFRYDVTAFEEREELTSRPQNEKAAVLVDSLGSFPIRYAAFHFYTQDDAA